MVKKTLKASDRKISGRKVKTLRNQGILPANVYGKKVKSRSIQIDLKEFTLLYKEVGETGLSDLVIENDSLPVLIHHVQNNPRTGDAIHVDFLQVDLKVKITAEVSIELIGESLASKQGIGTAVQQLNEVEVEALPGDLPEKFEVDVTNLADVDQAIYVKDLKVDSNKVTMVTDAELIVVKVEPPQKEEVIDTPIVPVGAEGAVVADKPEESASDNKDSSKDN